MIGTGLAIYILAVLFFRSRSAQADAEAARIEMRAALEELRAAQDSLYQATGSFAASLTPQLGFRPAEHWLFRLEGDGVNGWSAVIGDSSLVVPPRACGIYVGEAALAPHRAAVTPGEVACW